MHSSSCTGACAASAVDSAATKDSKMPSWWFLPRTERIAHNACREASSTRAGRHKQMPKTTPGHAFPSIPRRVTRRPTGQPGTQPGAHKTHPDRKRCPNNRKKKRATAPDKRCMVNRTRQPTTAGGHA
eukprot:5270873-Amphidinium_carterae.2